MTRSTNILRLARDGVDILPLYAPDLVTCAVDLSDNTNLWGAPPAALRTLREAPGSALSRYPSIYSEPLRSALLHYLGLADVPGIGVVTGCGSDDVLDSTMRAFGAPGECVAFSAPTFSMIPILARLNGLTPVSIPLTESFDVDAEQLVDCKAKITYLCSPNNPTATAASHAAVEYVATHAQGVVLLDEAYAEFAPETFKDFVTRHERLLLARTFSKAFGLAGLRVGYAVGANDAVRLVERARGPYKVNTMAERAVLAALDESPGGIEWVREHVVLAIANRVRVVAELRTLGFTVLPSAANFVMVPTARAIELCQALSNRGVLVRAFRGMARDLRVLAENEGNALRIGVGPWEMMQTMLGALSEVLACG